MKILGKPARNKAPGIFMGKCKGSICFFKGFTHLWEDFAIPDRTVLRFFIHGRPEAGITAA
jgi:hypothetical protein